MKVLKIIILFSLIFSFTACEWDDEETEAERITIEKAVKVLGKLSTSEIMDKKYNSLFLNCDIFEGQANVGKLNTYSNIESFSVDLLKEDITDMDHEVSVSSKKLKVNFKTDGLFVYDKKVSVRQNGQRFVMIYSPRLNLLASYEYESGNKGAVEKPVLESHALTKDLLTQLEPVNLIQTDELKVSCYLLSGLKKEFQDHYKIETLDKK